MARTVLDINESLLALAAAQLGTTSKRATVEAALRVVAGKAARDKLDELIRATGKTSKQLDAALEQAWR